MNLCAFRTRGSQPRYAPRKSEASPPDYISEDARWSRVEVEGAGEGTCFQTWFQTCFQTGLRHPNLAPRLVIKHASKLVSARSLGIPTESQTCFTNNFRHGRPILHVLAILPVPPARPVRCCSTAALHCLRRVTKIGNKFGSKFGIGSERFLRT